MTTVHYCCLQLQILKLNHNLTWRSKTISICSPGGKFSQIAFTAYNAGGEISSYWKTVCRDFPTSLVGFRQSPVVLLGNHTLVISAPPGAPS